MLLGGDEIGRTQLGNNNAYCQDSPLSWTDWLNVDEDLLDFVCRLTHLRRSHAVFRRHRFFQGRPIHGTDIGDIAWFKPDGSIMSDDDWQVNFAKTLGVFLNGDALPWFDARGHPVRSGSFFMVFNARRRVDRVHAAEQPVGRTVGLRARHRPPGHRTRQLSRRKRARRSASPTARSNSSKSANRRHSASLFHAE